MNILVIDDDRITRELLREVLERDGYNIHLASSGEEALGILQSQNFPIVLSDIRMHEMSGMGILTHIRKQSPTSVVVLMTGFGNMEGAIEAIQKGAFDYISKPFQLDDMRAVLKRAAKHWEQSQGGTKSGLQIKSLTQAPRSVIGKSPKIVEVYKTLARATLSPSNVLIQGESGTGKELVARAIHENSSRKEEPFVAINCGALAENLLESELFGHLKGSFTGAISNKVGLFEEAGKGTIFLDEIGDITPALQVKLLRIVQEGEFKPVGSNEVKKSSARIIAATHRHLEEMVQEGIFREDLYYRLKVVLIELPPLRDRMEDLPDLVSHFVAVFASKIGKPVSHISEEAMQILLSYAWPGNVRELEHAIERAVTMTRASVLYPEDFPTEIKGSSSAPALTSLEQVEKTHILKVLESTGWNKSKAAAMLGIDRKTLHRKAQRYEIELKEK